ncbi:hypothetical protein C8J57DRAFT_1483851 [Mycena rebaudengoi]|nr:hypothetical protein C8J57DRAFT_1483851 [Mycena rebaudengoi]
MWIRRSTGRLCVELAVPSYDSNPITSGFRGGRSWLPGTPLFCEPQDHSKIIKANSMENYHAMDTHEVSTNTLVHLGSVVYMPDGCDIPQEVACLSDPEFEVFDWRPRDWSDDNPCRVLGSGWTRVNSSDARHRAFELRVDTMEDVWLAQANHIFDSAKIPSKYGDYGFIYWVKYSLNLCEANDIPHGYLFLCPLQDLRGSCPSEFRYPACPAYWSLDPSGTQRLGSEEAERLGFPSFTLRTSIWIYSWDDLAYAGIAEFHQAKCFDPYSQDVARELGYPLFEVCVHKTEVSDDDLSNGAFCEEVASHEPSERKESSCEIDDADLLELTLHWKLFMGAQFAVIVILTIFSLYEHYFF